MRIIYLITKSGLGGAQTHIFQLCRYVRGKEVESAVMAHPGGWLEHEIKRLGLPFYPNTFLSNSPNPIAVVKASRIFRDAVKGFKPDLISCHSSVAGIIGRFSIKDKIPTIFTAHGWGFTDGTPFLRRLMLIPVERMAAKYCEKIICVSENDRQLALAHKIARPDQLMTIYNGVEVDNNPFTQKNFGRLPLKAVFVGRLAKPKDPLALLRAVKSLPEDLKSKIEIKIIGEGPKKKILEEYIRANELKNISLLGELPRSDVLRVIESSHIFVLISKWEGLPLSILEAMSGGLAVIASDVGGVGELIGGGAGILIKRGDEQALREALENLITHPAEAEKLARTAFARVKKDFTLERMLKGTVEVYEVVLKEASISE